MANGVVKPPAGGVKRGAAETVKELGVEDMRSALNAYCKTNRLEPVPRKAGGAEVVAHYGALKEEYEGRWEQKLSDQDFYGMLVRESKFIYVPFAKIRLFFSELMGTDSAQQDSAEKLKQEKRRGEDLLQDAGVEKTPEMIDSALKLVRCGMFANFNFYRFGHGDYKRMLADPDEYARRYIRLKESTTSDIYAGEVSLPNAIENVDNAIANYNLMKEKGYVGLMCYDTETEVGLQIGKPLEEFGKWLDREGKGVFTEVVEKRTYKEMVAEHRMNYFHRYMDTLIDEQYVPDSALSAYYKGVPLPAIRAILESGEVRGNLWGAVWVARDIGLAEAYISRATGIKMEWSGEYYSGCGVIVEFRKGALEREFKIGHGQGDLVNETDVRNPGKASAIPFTKEYVARVLVYEENVYNELSAKLAGTGIEAVMMSEEVASEYMERDAYLQLGSASEESVALHAARKLFYKDDYEGVLSACDEILKSSPQCAEAHIVKATALAELKRHEEALAECYSAVAIGPFNSRAYRVLEKSMGELNSDYAVYRIARDIGDSLRKRGRGERRGRDVNGMWLEAAIDRIAGAGSVEEALKIESVRSALRDASQITDPKEMEKIDSVLAKLRESAGSGEKLAAIEIFEQLALALREGSPDELRRFDGERFGGKGYEAAVLLEAGDAGGLRKMFPDDDPQKLIEFWKSGKEADGTARAMEYLRIYPLRER